ncbi:MAG: PhzF family phenazine biosynthesis protein, partial [Janthinobacterium lividum]
MAQVRFKQVDVFTSVRFKGNPVAVILRGDDLSSEQMQQIANWTNLSETTFVLPAFQAGADYRVRIFTPGSELPFAGHPTIGTAHALLEAGAITPKQGVLVQECKAGLVTLQVSRKPDGSQSISFTLPQASITPLDAAAVTELEAILGAPVNASFPPCLVDVGPRWIVAQMESGEAVLENKPDLQRMARQDTGARATGVTI